MRTHLPLLDDITRLKVVFFKELFHVHCVMCISLTCYHSEPHDSCRCFSHTVLLERRCCRHSFVFPGSCSRSVHSTKRYQRVETRALHEGWYYRVIKAYRLNVHRVARLCAVQKIWTAQHREIVSLNLLLVTLDQTAAWRHLCNIWHCVCDIDVRIRHKDN